MVDLPLLPLTLAALALAAVACGDPSSTGATDGGSDGATDDAAFMPSPHEPFPQLPNQGGPRLAHPALVTITFAGDSRRADLEGFAQWIVGSTWLGAVGGEYGVGAGTVAGAVVRMETPPAMTTSGDIEEWLAAGIQNGSLPKPAGGLADALYIVYYPSTTSVMTTFVDGIMKASCTDWEAYHGEAHVGGIDFSYAVIADCSPPAPGLSALETDEVAASHELIEAATDAFPITRPAWQLRPDPTDAWYGFFQFEVENADLCELEATYWREAGHVAQRVWSNVAAAAGGDPCVPSSQAKPYFNTTATPDKVQHVAAGGSVDYTLRGWAVAPGKNWKLEAQAIGSLAVKLSLSAPTMNDGGMATLHVVVPADAAPGSSAQIVLWSVRSSSDVHAWPLDVVTP